jgi:photosystem II stability/assembly factor-like uncharacterized protein
MMNKAAVFIILIISGFNSYAQWLPQNSNLPGTALYGVKFVSSMVGWAVGNGGTIIKTTDGGTTWISQSSGTTFHLYSVSFIDTANGMAVGGNGSRPIILRTTNGGTNWTEQLISGITNSLSSVSFLDTINATAVSFYSNTIIHTTNGGATWILHSPFGVYYYLYSVTFVDKNNGTAVGYDDNNYFRLPNGLVMATTNGGGSWEIQTIINGFSPLMGVSFSDAKNGIAAGLGYVLITKDGGANWTKSIVPSGQLYSVSFSDINNCTVVGENGQILQTIDRGASWTMPTSGTGNTLFGVSFTDAYNGTAVGNNGVILRTTNGGVTFIGEENITPKPQEFIIAQNFPNPFNPGTTINYSLPKPGIVKLTVYNILGSEVATLVNEYKLSGNYSVQFNHIRPK